MKLKTKSLIAFAFLLLLGLDSCDYVSNPYEGIVLEVIDEPRRKALIMDFTGHNCVNCPQAAVEAKKIKDDYPDQVELVAIHCDFTSLCTPQLNNDGTPANEDGSFATDWRTAEGTFYQNAYAIPFLPFGSVSGVKVGEDISYLSGEWRQVTESIIAQEPLLEIEISSSFNQGSREYDLSTTVSTLVDIEGNIGVVVMLLESNIQDWQYNGSSSTPADPAFPGGFTDQYLHQHILRKTMNNTLGDDYISGSAIGGFVMEFDFNSEIDDEWVEDEMEALVVVIDQDTYEILHVESTHITTGE